MPPRLRTCLLAVGLAAAAVAVYAPALRGGWLWDDPTEVLDNPLLRDAAGLGRIWRGVGTPDYFPLKTSVQWLEWHLWGANVLGYHCVSLALHVASALLLWALLRRLRIAAAYVGALLFAVHPLAVESVAWISELKNVLSLPLGLGSTLAFITFATTGRRTAYGLSLGLFTAALLAKSSLVPLPAVFALYLWWRRRKTDGGAGRPSRSAVSGSNPGPGQSRGTVATPWAGALALGPFLVIAAMLALVTIHFQRARVIALVAMPPEPLATRLAAGGWAVWFYLGKCLWPAGLLPIYPRWLLAPAWAWLLPSWLALGAGTAALVRLRHRPWARTLGFGLGAFVLLLTPVLGIVPLAYTRLAWVSDHLAYPALAAFAALAAAALDFLMRQVAAPAGANAPWYAWRKARVAGSPSAGPRPARSVAAQRLLVLFTAGLLLAAAAGARSYAAHFGSEERLWRFTAARNPSAWLAWNNLGIVDAQAGRLDAAIDELQRTVALQPNLEGARLNLGRALASRGRLQEAAGQFAAALALEPGNADARSSLRAAHNNLGTALARAGQLEPAVAEFRLALAAEPANAGVHQNLGYALRSLGRDAEAQREFAAAAGLRSTTGGR